MRTIGRVLRRLRIENLVLIREAELELDSGLNAITGETGAGKTILAGAIGVLLGARGEAALIGAGGEEAYVEAEFDLAGDEALGPLAELRPAGEDALVAGGRIIAGWVRRGRERPLPKPKMRWIHRAKSPGRARTSATAPRPAHSGAVVEIIGRPPQRT